MNTYRTRRLHTHPSHYAAEKLDPDGNWSTLGEQSMGRHAAERLVEMHARQDNGGTVILDRSEPVPAPKRELGGRMGWVAVALALAVASYWLVA